MLPGNLKGSKLIYNPAYLGRVATKPVFGISDEARFKPVSSATETSWKNRNFACSKLRYGDFQTANNKGADQTARMRSLVCAFVVRKPRKTGFLATRPILGHRFKKGSYQFMRKDLL